MEQTMDAAIKAQFTKGCEDGLAGIGARSLSRPYMDGKSYAKIGTDAFRGLTAKQQAILKKTIERTCEISGFSAADVLASVQK